MKLLLYIKMKSDNHVILEMKLSSYSKSSNGNDFIVFKIGFSRFINKLSLRSNLNLLKSVAKMLKSSKFMAQLHCNRWSDIADCLTFLRRFPVRLENPHVFSRSGIKVAEGFPIKSNLAVTTRITINYFRAGFFLKWILESKQCVKSTLRSKIHFQFTIW